MKANTETIKHAEKTTSPAQSREHTASPMRKTATVLALALALLFGDAALAPDQADAHTGGHASCITTTNTGFWQTKTTATNNCGHTINIKIHRPALSDSSCFTVRSGSSLVWNQGFWGSGHSTGVPC